MRIVLADEGGEVRSDDVVSSVSVRNNLVAGGSPDRVHLHQVAICSLSRVRCPPVLRHRHFSNQIGTHFLAFETLAVFGPAFV